MEKGWSWAGGLWKEGTPVPVQTPPLTGPLRECPARPGHAPKLQLSRLMEWDEGQPSKPVSLLALHRAQGREGGMLAERWLSHPTSCSCVFCWSWEAFSKASLASSASCRCLASFSASSCACFRSCSSSSARRVCSSSSEGGHRQRCQRARQASLPGPPALPRSTSRHLSPHLAEPAWFAPQSA